MIDLKHKPRRVYGEAIAAALRVNPNVAISYNTAKTRVFIYMKGANEPTITAECVRDGFKYKGRTYPRLTQLVELL